MCGRFYIDEESNQELLNIIRNLDKRLAASGQPRTIKTGEVFPSDTVPVIAGSDNKCTYEAMTWGFMSPSAKRPVINARSESAHEKPMFSQSLLTQRVVIPASGFFEWDHSSDKEKYYFTDKNGTLLYMAGMYRYYEAQPRFVILTTAANACMEPYHDRMPVLLEKDEVASYLLSPSDTNQYLKRVPKLLNPRQSKDVFSSKNTKMESFSQLKLPF